MQKFVPTEFLTASELFRLGYNMYNQYNDPRNNLRGSLYPVTGKTGSYGRGTRYFKGRRKTSARRFSVVRQRTIKAPLSITQDTKYVDTVGTFLNLRSNNPWGIINLSAVAAGTGGNQRASNNTRVLNIYATFQFIEGSPDQNSTYRIIMGYTKSANNGTDPGLSQILNVDANSNYTPLSLRNVDYLNDWVILLDKMVFVPDAPSTGGADVVRNFRVKCSVPQRYNGTTASSIVDNPIHCYLITTSPNGTTGGTGQYCIRVEYTDT